MFECEYCKRQLKNSYKLSEHKQKFHPYECDIGEPVEILVLKFGSHEEFNVWKNKEEISSLSRYVQHRGATMNKDKTIMTKKYYCHRSGLFISQNKGKRALKLNGSVKIDQRCPSFIQTVAKDNIVYVKYYKTHMGHENEAQFLPIPNFVQESIAGKIKSGVPPNVIIQQLRDDFDNVEQINLITRKYVYNVAAKFGLLDKYKLNEDAQAKEIKMKQFAQQIHAVNLNLPEHKKIIIQGDICKPLETDENSQTINETSQDNTCNPLETYDITLNENVISQGENIITQEDICNSFETDDSIQGNNVISQGDICNSLETDNITQGGNAISQGDNVTTQDNVCDSMETDTIYMKLPAMGQLTETSNKIKDFYKLFMSVAGTLNDQQFKKINSSLDEGLSVLFKQKHIMLEDKKLKLLCKQEYNILKDIENSNLRTCNCFTSQKTKGKRYR